MNFFKKKNKFEIGYLVIVKNQPELGICGYCGKIEPKELVDLKNAHHLLRTPKQIGCRVSRERAE